MCIGAMRNNRPIVQRMAALSPGDCAISTITSYELYTGIEKCADPAKERSKVDLLLATVHQLAFDVPAAREAGRLRALLESQGRMIGPHNILLAGQALAAGLILVTANTGEFSRVPALQLENWQASPGPSTSPTMIRSTEPAFLAMTPLDPAPALLASRTRGGGSGDFQVEYVRVPFWLFLALLAFLLAQCGCRFGQVTPPTTSSVRGQEPHFCSRERQAAQCFGTGWNVAPTRDRIVTPPDLSLPGPFVSRCCHLPLAA